MRLGAPRLAPPPALPDMAVGRTAIGTITLSGANAMLSFLFLAMYGVEAGDAARMDGSYRGVGSSLL